MRIPSLSSPPSSIFHLPSSRSCLSRLHDAAFDHGLITFDADHRLVLSRELRSAVTNTVLRSSFEAFEGKALRPPERFMPERAFLERHRGEVFRG